MTSKKAEGRPVHLFGVIVVDKPFGLTSFDVVARARRRFRTRSIGHTGTLDPMATGVLPLCIAEATRIAQFLASDDKEYEAELELGQATDTQDRLGHVISEIPVPPLTNEEIESTLVRFLGPQSQVPPMFSAIRVDGERLYEKARRGEVVDRQARNICIHAIQLTARPAPNRIRFRVHCSKGTYIRTLGCDIASSLGTVGHLTMLRRLRAGDFSIERSVSLDELFSLSDEELHLRILNERQALSSMRELSADSILEKHLRNGLKLPSSAIVGIESVSEKTPVKIISSDDGVPIAIVSREGNSVRYLRGLPRVADSL